jgi:hypothetical protein
MEKATRKTLGVIFPCFKFLVEDSIAQWFFNVKRTAYGVYSVIFRTNDACNLEHKGAMRDGQRRERTLKSTFSSH